MKLPLSPETCCGVCNDIIFSYLDCPACGKTGQSWGSPYEMDVGESIECERCKVEFELVSKSDFLKDWEWNKPQ